MSTKLRFDITAYDPATIDRGTLILIFDDVLKLIRDYWNEQQGGYTAGPNGKIPTADYDRAETLRAMSIAATKDYDNRPFYQPKVKFYHSNDPIDNQVNDPDFTNRQNLGQYF